MFSLFAAKDSWANLKTALLRYKDQVNILKESKWRLVTWNWKWILTKPVKPTSERFTVFNFLSTTHREKKQVVFLFGDYEFLCKVFGIAGASGNYDQLYHTNTIIQNSQDHAVLKRYFRATIWESASLLLHLQENINAYGARSQLLLCNYQGMILKGPKLKTEPLKTFKRTMISLWQTAPTPVASVSSTMCYTRDCLT